MSTLTTIPVSRFNSVRNFMSPAKSSNAVCSLRVGLIVALTALLVPALALAAGAPVGSGGGTQTGTAAMALPSITKVRGVRSGDFTLMPSIGVIGHHDTNVFNGNEQDVGNSPVAGTSLRLAPKLGLTNSTSSEVQFQFDAKGDVRIYMSEIEELSELTNFGGTADLGVTLAARKAISFTMFDHFTRSLQADNWQTLNNLNRVHNEVGGRVSFHPGEIPERRPFEVSLLGSYVVDKFEKFVNGSTSAVRTRLTSSWRFLPKTAFIFDATWDFRKFDNSNLLGITSNNRPWRVTTGLAGAVSKRVTARLTGGYGMSLHDSGPQFSAPIWGVGIGYRASATTLVNLDYTHNFYDAFMGNFVDFHRGSASLNQRFGAMLDVTLYGTVTYGVYGALAQDSINQIAAQTKDVTGISVAPVRTDVVLDAGIRANFEISRVLGAGLSYRFNGVFTDFVVKTTDNRILDVGSYTSNELQASLTLRY